MITLNDLKNNGIYIDQCITYSIPIMCFIPFASIKTSDNIYKRYDAQMLAEISQLNMKLEFMMNNFTKIQKDSYLYEIINNDINTRLYRTAISATDLQNVAKILATNLSTLRDKLNKFYVLPTGSSLSIYSTDTMDNGINLYNEKNKYPSTFNFYEGRLFLNKITNIIEQILKSGENRVLDEESLGFSVIDKINALINLLLDSIQIRLDLNKLLEEFMDYNLVALITYQQFNFTTQSEIDVFFNRPYSIIKLDIISALENYL